MKVGKLGNVGGASVYIISRYVLTALLFVRNVMAARWLSPYYFGVWSVLQLVKQYLSYSNMGLPYGMLVELSRLKGDVNRKRQAIVGFSMWSTLGLVVVTLIGAAIAGVLVRPEYAGYGLGSLLILLAVGVCVGHFEQALSAVCRVDGQFPQITAAGLGSGLVSMLAFVGKGGEGLLYRLVIWMTVGGGVSVAILLTKARLGWARPSWEGANTIVAVSTAMLLYNISHYLIPMSTRTIVGKYYSAELMGQFSLANSLSAMSSVGVYGLMWVLYPRLIKMGSTGSNEDIERLVEVGSRQLLIVTSGFVCISLLGSRTLFYVLAEYGEARVAFEVLLMSQVFLMSAFVHNSVAVGRKLEYGIAKCAGTGVILSILITLFIAAQGGSITGVALGMVIANGVYAYLQVMLLERELPEGKSCRRYWNSMWTSGTMAVVGVVSASVALRVETWGGIVGMAILATTNWRFGRDQWLQMRAMESERIGVGKGWENGKE